MQSPEVLPSAILVSFPASLFPTYLTFLLLFSVHCSEISSVLSLLLDLFFVSALHQHLDSFIRAMAVHGIYDEHVHNSHMTVQMFWARVSLLLDPMWFANE